MEIIQMTEPAVKPAEPITKPKPSREVKPKPNRDDPWTVPAPKVNPTPKAIITTVMRTKDFNTKMKVLTKGEFDMLMDIMTPEAFFKKFTVCDKLVTRMLADDAVTHVAFTDVIAQ